MKNTKLLFLLFINFYSMTFTEDKNTIVTSESGEISWSLPPTKKIKRHNAISSILLGTGALSICLAGAFFLIDGPKAILPDTPINDYIQLLSKVLFVEIIGCVCVFASGECMPVVYDIDNYGAGKIEKTYERNSRISQLRSRFGNRNTQVITKEKKI